MTDDIAQAVRIARIEPAGGSDRPPSSDRIVLAHDERRVRRRRLTTEAGLAVLVDLPAPVTLHGGDRLVLDDGRPIEVIAAEEPLLEVRAPDGRALTALAWQIGNRHLAAQIEGDRILVRRDHVIAAMLRGLGARVREIEGPFEPEGGAYSGHDHSGPGEGAHAH